MLPPTFGLSPARNSLVDCVRRAAKESDIIVGVTPEHREVPSGE